MKASAAARAQAMADSPYLCLTGKQAASPPPAATAASPPVRSLLVHV